MLVALLAAPVASHAAEHEKHVKCEITNGGKTETNEVKSADECTKMGGKVAPEKK